MRISPALANDQARLTAERIAGGFITVLDARDAALVTLDFPTDPIEPDQETLRIRLAAIAGDTGTPTKFVVGNRAGKAVLDGTVGKPGTDVDIEYEPELIVAAGLVELDFTYQVKGVAR